MNICPDALAPTDEELLSVTSDDQALPAEEQQHLEQCPICQQRLASYVNIRNLLVSKLYRSLCPSAVDLNYYCIDMLPEQQRISIASHILNCPLCADEIAEIRQVQASGDLFPTLAPSLGTTVRRIFATPVVPQVRLVTRGNIPGTRWPRQYQADSIHLSLRLSRASNREMVLLGIIGSTNTEEPLDAFEGVKTELYTSSELSAAVSANDQSYEQTAVPLLSTQIDKIGNMVLRPVPVGEYVLIIHLPDRDLVIENITVEHKSYSP